MNPDDWGGLLFLVLLSIPVVMLFRADNQLREMQRAQRRAARRNQRRQK